MKICIMACFVLALFIQPVCAATANHEGVYTTLQGTRYKEQLGGQGEVARMGDVAVIHFEIWLEEAGQRGPSVFSTRAENRPVSFVIGADNFMPGLSDGVTGMQAGGQRTLIVPSHLAYGEKGVPGSIPGGANLIIDVELLELERRN